MIDDEISHGDEIHSVLSLEDSPEVRLNALPHLAIKLDPIPLAHLQLDGCICRCNDR